MRFALKHAALAAACLAAIPAHATNGYFLPGFGSVDPHFARVFLDWFICFPVMQDFAPVLLRIQSVSDSWLPVPPS